MRKLGKWWTGTRCRCKQCGEQFELQEQDKPIPGPFDGPYFQNVRCPDCGEWVAVDKPWNA